MLALKVYRDGRCPSCGGNLNVTTASENEDRFRPLPPLQCFRCVGFGHSHKAHEDNPHPNSLIHLVPQEPTKAR